MYDPKDSINTPAKVTTGVVTPREKRRWVVEVRTSSWGYYEVEANSQDEIAAMDPNRIRASKVVNFKEEVNVTNSMEIRNP